MGRSRGASAPRLPLDDALSIARQIADALETAHEQGIVHRDLKPANVKVREDGTVKVLDFGLAKALGGGSQDPASGDVANSPTMTSPALTAMGLILGTAAYMAPEQARGKPVDKRADIWAFGVVLYEMLSGCRAFDPSRASGSPRGSTGSPRPEPVEGRASSRGEGDSVAEVLAAVLRQDIDLGALPSNTPVAVRRLIARCLDRNPKTRLRDIGEARVLLSSPQEEPPVAINPPPARPALAGRVLRAAALTAIGFVAGFGSAAVVSRPAAVAPSTPALSITPITASGNVISASVSPDGRYVAYVESDQGLQSLWLQQVAGGQTLRLVPDQPVAYWGHTFTPDGNTIVFGLKSNDVPDGALYSISTLGGAPKRLVGNIDSAPTYSPDGRRMAFLRLRYPRPDQTALIVTDADGSNEKTLATVTLPEYIAGIFFGGPAWAPDGRTIVTAMGLRGSPGADARAKLVQVDVDSGQVTTLADPGWTVVAQAGWLPDGKSLLVIARSTEQTVTQIWSVSVPGGGVRRVTADLSDHRIISLTRDGRALVSIAGSLSTRVSLLPLDGRSKPVRVSRATYDGSLGVAFAPDGRVIYSSEVGETSSAWVARADGSDRSPFIEARTGEAVTSPLMAADGSVFYVAASRKGFELRAVSSDGSSTRTIASDARRDPISASADGRVIAFSAQVDGVPHIFSIRPDGTARSQVTTTPSYLPAVDPKGRRVAYYYHAPDGRARIGVSSVAGGPLLADLSAEAPGANSRLVLTDAGIYLNTVQGDRANVWLQPLDGRPARRVTAFDDDIMLDFAVSPDGQSVAVVQGTRLRDAQLITGFDAGSPR